MIQSFHYRSPRLAARLPVELVTDGGVLFGSTRDFSEHGLRADFGEPVLSGSFGKVRFRAGHCVVELQAEVTHSEGFATGIVFAFSSERERSVVRAILQVLTKNAKLSTDPGSEGTPV